MSLGQTHSSGPFEFLNVSGSFVRIERLTQTDSDTRIRMTDEPIRDREDDVDELAEKALNEESDNQSGPDEPWAKTSSGDKDNIASGEDE